MLHGTMNNWGMDTGMMWGMGTFSIAIIVVLVLLVIALVKYVFFK